MAADPIWASINADGTFVSPKIQAAIDARAKAALVPQLDGKRGVEATELGTEHLDTVTTPGVYTQSSNIEATLETGYPATRGGVLQVERSVSKTMVWQTYTTYATSATNPPQTWQRGSYNGTWSAWSKIGGAMPDGGQPGQVLTTGTDGKARWDTVTRGIKSVTQDSDATKATVTFTDNTTSTLDLPSGKDGAGWSKDAQAKAQGYWIVVSPTAPANATYTTADGTTVPVIWQKPVEQVVPVAPEEPFWGKGDTTITVAKLVGVDYKIAAFIKDGVSTPANVVIPEAQAFKLSTAPGAPKLPFSVQIEAVAEPGYRMLGKYQWTTLYLDPAGLSLMTSDGFSGADGTTIVNRPTDVYAGGAAKTWTRLNGGTTPSPVYAIKSNALAVEPSLGGTGFNEVFLNVGTSKQHVAFDLTWNTADTKALGFQVGLRNTDNRSLGGTFFEFGDRSVTYRAPGNNGGQPGYTAPSGGKLPNGRYILEAFNSTLAITAPGGSRQMFTTPDPGTDKGPYIYLRVNGNTGAAFTIDNLVINSVGA